MNPMPRMGSIHPNSIQYLAHLEAANQTATTCSLKAVAPSITAKLCLIF